MPVVGELRDAEWETAKLYVPHVARVLAELHAAGSAPTEASARLLFCSGAYAENVLRDYRQTLVYYQRLVDARVGLLGEEHADVAVALVCVAAMHDKLGQH